MSHNGMDGYYLFPITPQIAFAIRDNAQWRMRVPSREMSSANFDVFVLQGDEPSITQHRFSHCVGWTETYTQACDLIERMCAKAVTLKLASQVGTPTHGHTISGP